MSEHFPYRKYAYNLVIRRRRRRYHWRMNHDAWAWLLVAMMIGTFIVLECVR